MAASYALITSCSNYSPETLVKDIIGCELPRSEQLVENIEVYPWHVDTKYYTADVSLCTTSVKTIGNQEFAESVHAFVVHFNSNDMNSFDLVKSWLPFVREISPEVQILVCDSCSVNSVITKEAAWGWCLQNGFELVELEPATEAEEEEDDFQETTGIKRIVQALHAHTWPNLFMKDAPSYRSNLMNQMMREEQVARQQDSDVDNSGQMSLTSNEIESTNEASQSQTVNSEDTDTNLSNGPAPLSSSSDNRVNVHSEVDSGTSSNQGACGSSSLSGAPGGADLAQSEKQKKDEQNKQKKLTLGLGVEEEENHMFAALRDEDPGGDAFEQAFANLRVMKERAEGLPPEERKKYAEKVAVEFWKAIGGDEAEIDGICDSD